MKVAGALLTGLAVALGLAVYFGGRSRPALAPADFTAEGPDALEFCSDVRPKFIPVANKLSPVVLKVVDDHTVRLSTAAGKPIGPKDLSRPPRLFAVNGDATTLRVFRLSPATAYGDWSVPTLAGMEEIFADIVPLATGSEMYVEAAVHRSDVGAESTAAKRRSAQTSVAPMSPPKGYGLMLHPSQPLVRDPVDLSVGYPDSVRPDSLAVFDLAPGGATGMALVRTHSEVSRGQGGAQAREAARLTFDDPGRYAVWALGADGEPLRRFTITVSP